MVIRSHVTSRILGAVAGGVLAFSAWNFSPYLEPNYLKLKSGSFLQLPRARYGILSDIYRTTDLMSLTLEERKEALTQLSKLKKIYNEIDLDNLSKNQRTWLQSLNKEGSNSLEDLATTFENGFGYKGINVKGINDRDALFLWTLKYEKGYPVAIPQTTSYSGQQSPAATQRGSH